MHSSDIARQGMTFIPGRQKSNRTQLPASLGAFYIDRYEVSNEEFKRFVESGGYEDSRFWSELEFVQEGNTLSWQDAVSQFVDSTGELGPATWANGTFSIGRENYPVSGISWFEAMAYAKFLGKQLPTAHHMRWAADCHPKNAFIVTRLSNFSQQAKSPRGAHQGIGGHEVYDLAGNVREWCFNDDNHGRRLNLGGCWNDAEYQFFVPDAKSPWDRSEYNGFRCVAYGEGEPRSELLASIDLSVSDKVCDSRSCRTWTFVVLVRIRPRLATQSKDRSVRSVGTIEILSARDC